MRGRDVPVGKTLFTSVDFGRLTYFAEVARIAAAAGMEVVEDAPVPGSIDTASQTARLVVLKQKRP